MYSIWINDQGDREACLPNSNQANLNVQVRNMDTNAEGNK